LDLLEHFANEATISLSSLDQVIERQGLIADEDESFEQPFEVSANDSVGALIERSRLGGLVRARGQAIMAVASKESGISAFIGRNGEAAGLEGLGGSYKFAC
jgi:hypothetical protein